MKTKSVLIVAFAILCLPLLRGQNFDHLMVKKQMDCSDISHNSALLFKQYYQEGKLDSAEMLLDYWEQRCGPREPVFRAKLVLALRMGKYSDAMLDDKVFDHVQLINYRYNTEQSTLYRSYEAYKADFAYIPPKQEFDTFIAEAATALSKLYDSGTMERLWCDYLASPDDDIYAKLQDEPYSGTTLGKSYAAEVNKYKALQDFHWAVLGGVWVPNGMLSELGVHPDFGFLMGIKKNEWSYDFALTLKFGNTPDYYYAKRTKSTGDWEPTKHFLGGYIGIEVGKDIWAKHNQELQLNGGIGYDGFDVFESDDYYDETESTSSYNFNIGLGYRYYLKSGTYLGLRAKYNLVDYTLNNVIDHKGNVVTVHVVVGNLSNVYKRTNLQRLKYEPK